MVEETNIYGGLLIQKKFFFHYFWLFLVVAGLPSTAHKKSTEVSWYYWYNSKKSYCSTAECHLNSVDFPYLPKNSKRWSPRTVGPFPDFEDEGVLEGRRLGMRQFSRIFYVLDHRPTVIWIWCTKAKSIHSLLHKKARLVTGKKFRSLPR